MVSLWEFEWEEVQERGRWEVAEVEVGRGRESREVVTANPLSVHFIDVEEALTLNVGMTFTRVPVTGLRGSGLILYSAGIHGLFTNKKTLWWSFADWSLSCQ